MELTGGGRTKRSEIYPDKLCKAILEGLVKQMKADNRAGCSFRSDDVEINYVNFNGNWELEGDAKNFEMNEANERFRVTWTRKDSGTTRRMLPGTQGPSWSSCTRRITKYLDTGQVIEDRPVEEITGRERRREFRGGPKNIA